MIKLKEITKIYGKSNACVKALDSINIRIERGEFVGIMGPSGSGKTTMLNILGCMDTLTSGNYYLNEEDISQFNIARKAKLRNEHFGFVFQSFNLIAEKTAFENVMLPLKYSEVPKKERKGKAEKVLDMMGILDLKNRYPNEMSGGQQQRVAIARALVNDPEVILADEPTGNLDSKTGQEIMNVFRKLHNENNKTIVLITHDAKIAAFAGRVLQMVDGKIVNDENLCENSISFSNPFSEMETGEGA